MLAALLLAFGAQAAEEPLRGWTPAGLPLLNYNSDEGLGYGARVLLVDHGDGHEQPFRMSVMAQFFQTTKGVAAHRLFLDMPGFLGSAYRMDLDVAWSIDKFSPWYGPGNGASYDPAVDTCADHGPLSVDPSHCAGTPAFRGLRFYRYDRNTLPRLKLNFRGPLAGPWKFLAGVRFSLNRITPFYGPDDLGQQGESQLALDARAGRISGYEGDAPFTRREGFATLGLVYDTRDNEPAAHSGMFLEGSLRAGSRALGGEDEWQGGNLNLRFFQALGTPRVVAALRVLADAMVGDVPFFLLNTTGGLDGPEGVGGQFTLRGLLKNRLQGMGKLLLTPELRGTAYEGSHLDLRLVAALDLGRVWAQVGKADPGPWRAGGSLGFRAAWNRDFVVRVDLGLGLSESYADKSLYVTFDEMF